MAFTELLLKISWELLDNAVNVRSQRIVIMHHLTHTHDPLQQTETQTLNLTFTSNIGPSCYLSDVMQIFIRLCHVYVQFSSSEVAVIQRVPPEGREEHPTRNLH